MSEKVWLLIQDSIWDIGLNLTLSGISEAKNELSAVNAMVAENKAGMESLGEGVQYAVDSFAMFSKVESEIVDVIGSISIKTLLILGLIALLGPLLFFAGFAFEKFGKSIYYAGTGIYKFVEALNMLSEITPKTYITMSLIIADLGGMAIGILVVSKKLKLATKGFLIFGKAVALGGIGVLAVAAGFWLLAHAMLMLNDVNETAIAAFTLIAAVMGGVIFGLIKLGAVAIKAGKWILLLGAGVLLLGLGFIAMAVAVVIVSMAGMEAVGVILSLSKALGSVALAVGLLALACFALFLSLLLLGGFALATAVMIAIFGAAIGFASVGARLMAVALRVVDSSMRSIANNAKSASSSLSGMVRAVDTVNAGLSALGNKAKGAVRDLVNAFRGGTGDAGSAGRDVVDAIRTGIESGVTPLPMMALAAMATFATGIGAGAPLSNVAAVSIATVVVAALGSAERGALKSGMRIGAGFAGGMRSMLGQVQAVATQLAAAADAAVRARARINSPSRMTMELGEYFGEGFAIGIASMKKYVKDVSEDLVAIPNINTSPELSYSGFGTLGGNGLQDNYAYHTQASYVIHTHVDLDGREIARGTAEYNREEQEKLERRFNRKQGRWS
ncbi:MAG: hypothetical protein FWE25_08815 [Lachnospiraceae bacterium]|nr:hypothetical protein [Lachnospiraceae bacterium]